MNPVGRTIQHLPVPASAPVLALGAFLKNRACWLHGSQVHWSALHGDLSDPAACEALRASAQALLAAAPVRPAAVAHDLHPDFHSTHLAQALAAELAVPAVPVQHHRAHIAAVLAEHGHVQPAIGIALDGVGLGLDGSAWGGEVLRLDRAGAPCPSGDSVGTPPRAWARLAHLPTLVMPGGDAAAREPWRMAAAVLHALGRSGEILPRFERQAGRAACRTVGALLAKNLRCPPSSAAGRWFDAAAAALGVHQGAQAEAEAACALEAEAALFAAQATRDEWPADPDLFAAVSDCLNSPPAARAAVAWRFHAMLAACVSEPAVRQAAGVGVVALGGGCFHNRLLGPMITKRLRQAGLDVLAPRELDCGDSALALGQAWVAAGLVTGDDRH